MQVNIHEAKTNFSRLIEAVERGEEVIIARRGEPVARLVPCAKSERRVQLGTLAGRGHIDPSFYDDMTDEELADWYGEDPANPTVAFPA